MPNEILVPYTCACGAGGLTALQPALIAELAGSASSRAETLADRGQRAVCRLERLKEGALRGVPTQGEVLAVVDAVILELTTP